MDINEIITFGRYSVIVEIDDVENLYVFLIILLQYLQCMKNKYLNYMILMINILL